MAPRTAGTADDEFDLTCFLWGDLPPLPEQPGAGQSDVGAGIRTPTSDDVLLAEAFTPRESSPTWDALATRSIRENSASPAVLTIAEEDFDPDADIDLDALAEWANLIDAVTVDDNQSAATAQAEETDAFRLDERPRSYGELTERLRREVLPRLRWLAASRGSITLGHLARIVVNLQGSEAHLAQVRAFLERTSVRILPSRAHDSARHLPLWAIQQSCRRFGDLLCGQIDEQEAIARIGYDGVPLSQESHAILIQAWTCHCLAREEERACAMTVAAEVARAGADPSGWSAAALEAREALVRDNLWLVARMTRRHVGRGVALDDLLHSGALAVSQAVVRFDPARGYRFASFASGWVSRSLTGTPTGQTLSILRVEQRNGHADQLPDEIVGLGWPHLTSDIRHPTSDSTWETMGRARPHAVH